MLTEDILNIQEDPIIIINDKNMVIFANKSALDLGFVLPNYKNKSYYEVVRPFELISYINTILGQDKELKLNHLNKTYNVSKKNVKDMFVIFMKDITKHEQYQKAKREFIANASHELKTPISIISSVLDIIKDKTKEENLLKFIQKAKRACESMESLINDMITLSYVESLDENVKLEDYVDIKSLIHEIVEMFDVKNITVNINVESKIIKTNKKLLETILKNLIDNAIKYNKPNGSISIYSRNSDVFELFIEDTGIGIAPSHLPFIFERFYSVSKDRSLKSTGLGLAIVKHTSKLLKINIDVNSKLDVGTTFRLRFL